MGNFSRPPDQRLDDAAKKHYVGVRVEQGVPLLDADLHLLDGLHRHELEQVGQWMLGNGVPVGSDAFRVLALAGGGVNTVVLQSKTSTVIDAFSSLQAPPRPLPRSSGLARTTRRQAVLASRRRG